MVLGDVQGTLRMRSCTKDLCDGKDQAKLHRGLEIEHSTQREQQEKNPEGRMSLLFTRKVKRDHVVGAER